MVQSAYDAHLKATLNKEHIEDERRRSADVIFRQAIDKHLAVYRACAEFAIDLAVDIGEFRAEFTIDINEWHEGVFALLREELEAQSYKAEWGRGGSETIKVKISWGHAVEQNTTEQAISDKHWSTAATKTLAADLDAGHIFYGDEPSK